MRDTGLLHTLLGIRTERDLLAHPKCGASWEGYAVEEVINVLAPEQVYFWATHQGAELDLMLFKRSRRIGIEIKRADAPTITPSMRIALADLGLEQLIVLYPGSRTYDLDRHLHVVPLSRLASGNLQAAIWAGKWSRRCASCEAPTSRRS